MFKQFVMTLTLSLSLNVVAAANNTAVTPSQLKKDIEQFSQMMISEHQFTQAELSLWFAQAAPHQGILKTIKRPAEAAMPWYKYRNIFIQQDRIDLGKAFWKKHLKTLNRAEKEFGVPAEVVVGLIGVETKYGRIKGNHDVFNSLYTLGFHYPRRSKFFRKELKEFLILARDQKWTPKSIKGSYAGAMGYGQFMPSSYRMYAVDFDQDGKIDLLNNPVDAIGSVANYIKVHGWKKQGDIIYKASVKGTDYKKVLQNKIKPTKSLKEIQNAGVSIAEEVNTDQLAILIELEQKDQQAYWIGLHNFYVISRYNPRTFYTMAVVQLTQMIKQQYLADSMAKVK